MSFCSQHMNFPVAQPRNLKHQELTVKMVAEMSWDDIAAEDPQLTGNTRFNDFSLVAVTLLTELNLNRAAETVGYRGPTAGGAGALATRLGRVNCTDILSIYRILIKAEKLPKNHWTTLLTNGYRRMGQLNIKARRIGELVCQNALEKAEGDLEKTAKKLGISENMLKVWLS